MQYIQLEFDFVKAFAKKRGFVNWVTEHMRPEIGWSNNPNPYADEEECNNLKDAWNNVMEHIKIGFSFRWKF